MTCSHQMKLPKKYCWMLLISTTSWYQKWGTICIIADAGRTDSGARWNCWRWTVRFLKVAPHKRFWRLIFWLHMMVLLSKFTWIQMTHLALCLSAFRATSFLVIGCRKDILNRKAKQIAYTTSIVPHHRMLLSYETKIDQIMKVFGNGVNQKEKPSGCNENAIKWTYFLVFCLESKLLESDNSRKNSRALATVCPNRPNCKTFSPGVVPRGSIAILHNFGHKHHQIRFHDSCAQPLSTWSSRWTMGENEPIYTCIRFYEILSCSVQKKCFGQVTIKSQQGSSTRHQIWGVPITRQDETQRCRNARALVHLGSIRFQKNWGHCDWLVDLMEYNLHARKLNKPLWCQHQGQQVLHTANGFSQNNHCSTFNYREKDRGNCFLHWTLTRILYILGTLDGIYWYIHCIITLDIYWHTSNQFDVLNRILLNHFEMPWKLCWVKAPTTVKSRTSSTILAAQSLKHPRDLPREELHELTIRI